MSIPAIQNRFGFYPWEWKEFSWRQKLRMHFDAYRFISHYRCSFIQDRAEIWRGRVPISERQCNCGYFDEPGFRCWCYCANGVLRQGKINRKGEKVMKKEYSFLHHPTRGYAARGRGMPRSGSYLEPNKKNRTKTERRMRDSSQP